MTKSAVQKVSSELPSGAGGTTISWKGDVLSYFMSLSYEPAMNTAQHDFQALK